MDYEWAEWATAMLADDAGLEGHAPPPFPADHESRVKWAADNRHFGRFEGGTESIYCALDAVGLLRDDGVVAGSCRQRLQMARVARAMGIPIVPRNFYWSLQFCACPRLIVNCIAELIEHGHEPTEEDWAATVAHLRTIPCVFNWEKLDACPAKFKLWIHRLAIEILFP